MWGVVGTVCGMTSCIVGIVAFIIARGKAAEEKAKTEQQFRDSFAALEKQRESDMELQNEKMKNISEKLTGHIEQNGKEHGELKGVMGNIEDKFNRIMRSIAVLEERSCKNKD